MALRSFCAKRNGCSQSRKDLLIQKLKTKYCARKDDDLGSADSKQTRRHGNVCNSNALKKTRTVLISWSHRTKAGVVHTVKSQLGGGTRKIVVDKTAGREELLAVAKNLFFANGDSLMGSLTRFKIDITDFLMTSIDNEKTVEDISEERKLSGYLHFHFITSSAETPVASASIASETSHEDSSELVRFDEHTIFVLL